MAANLLHFGQELADRFPLLRNAGFSISLFDAFPDFRHALESSVDHDALSVSDLQPDVPSDFVQAARTYSRAPLILFRTNNLLPFRTAGNADRAANGSEAGAGFDLVVPPSPAGTWIADLAGLMACGRELRARSRQICEQSIQLRREMNEVIEKTLFETERARLQRAQGAPADLASFADKVLQCSNCRAEFVFTAGEQLFFQKRNFVHDPKVCKKCRSRRTGSPRLLPEIAVTCAECGAPTTVPFKPTQGRPVLCRFCFEKHRVAV